MTFPNKSTLTPVNRKLPRRWKVRHRLFLSILFAVIASFFLPSEFSLSTRILCVWNAGMICFLVSTWLLMLQAKPKTMRCHAQSQDEG